MILGFAYRFTESAGIGYTVLPGSALHLDLEAGPALRETRYIGDLAAIADAASPGADRSISRGSPAPTSSSPRSRRSMSRSDNSNITSTTALDTKLFGPVKARFSYNVTYEQDTPTVAKSFDTITTASLVYSF